ncbi:MAG: citrate/2-methylcitrate synthase [Enterococcus sp.]|nr:citrate/2-methylcitrate synthase [Enterococcus sp.]MBP7952520.1 citrate/2-methylcitrate synthase [Enterococcus sp.]MBP8692790.1 citrate/2-methylcitrate synthase [Enterococcus sp.]MBP9520376.1 citrate/2-methylcitrate synthase [Enterococcus sp.]MBP9638059.1 citrate/2-methylcitrate synthase [Enterococcus sp.]
MLTQIEENNQIANELYSKYEVKRGLRDDQGKGVVAGLTTISTVYPEKMVDGQVVAGCGELRYRGISIDDLVEGFVSEDRFGFEEVAYLLLFGELPNQEELAEFQALIASNRTLPTNFVRDVIMKAPSADVMNSLSRSVLTLASYDEASDDISLENVLSQSIMLISVFPLLAIYAYHAYNHYNKEESMYIHLPEENLSTAEALLQMLRPDRSYTKQEAQTLDMALVLHMEHGGGNNSTFTTRVVTSSGTDTYSTIAAALGSLKGPKHGGANIKVTQMMTDLKAQLTDYSDEAAVAQYLEDLLDKKAFDQKGLIYGMGHAIYSDNDPRAAIFKRYVSKLAEEKGEEAWKEYQLYTLVERLAPEIIANKRKMFKGVSANIDFFSGFVYNLLGLPPEIYTPIFAIARIVGWSAHRMEELVNAQKIIRPAYQEVTEDREYQAMADRQS